MYIIYFFNLLRIRRIYLNKNHQYSYQSMHQSINNQQARILNDSTFYLYCQAQPKLGLSLVWISPTHPGKLVKLDNYALHLYQTIPNHTKPYPTNQNRTMPSQTKPSQTKPKLDMSLAHLSPSFSFNLFIS